MTGVISSCIISMLFSAAAAALACPAGTCAGIVLALSEKGGLKENTSLYGVVAFLMKLMKNIPFILILLLVYLPLKDHAGDNFPIFISIFLEILPLSALSAFKMIKSVPEDIITAAIAMGAAPGEVIRLFVLPEIKERLIKKSLRLLSYALLCGLASRGWLLLLARF